MQRYEFCPEYETYEGKFTSQMEQDEDGKYVLYSDASSLLTASEARVKIFREHILTLCECLESDPEMAFDYTHQIRESRSALGDVTATKGEEK